MRIEREGLFLGDFKELKVIELLFRLIVMMYASGKAINKEDIIHCIDKNCDGSIERFKKYVYPLLCGAKIFVEASEDLKYNSEIFIKVWKFIYCGKLQVEIEQKYNQETLSIV